MAFFLASDTVDKEPVRPRQRHARVEDGGHIAVAVHHRHVVATRWRRFLRLGLFVAHLQQLETHPGVILGEDGLEGQGVCLRVALLAALREHLVVDLNHLVEDLRILGRRAELWKVEELEHIQNLDDVGAAIIRWWRSHHPQP